MNQIDLLKSTLFSAKKGDKYATKTAYFSMEFAIDQSLKIYSGGLGYLAGSHMRSAYELNQNMIGIGIFWKYGYSDQIRTYEGGIQAAFTRKNASFLEDLDIIFPITIHSSIVYVKVYYLPPQTFGCAPLFLLCTDCPENDYISRTISNRLYDSNEATRIAQSILLGVGGAKLLDLLDLEIDIYHLNEGHALPLCFYLYSKLKSLEKVREKVVFTTHTPEKAGNEEHDYKLLQEMTFFYDLDAKSQKEVLGNQTFRIDYTYTALRMSGKANAVSKLHAKVSNEMWRRHEDNVQIEYVTNAQNKKYWMDEHLEQAYKNKDIEAFEKRKLQLKKPLFEVVADQCGKLFDPKVATFVWARRFAGYKRADLIMRNFERFIQLVNQKKYPIQIIWAGKPYPEDQEGYKILNDIFYKTKGLKNCAVLSGYELHLSAILKKGSDVWVNTPRMYREASGTSGMTAAMNGSINLTIPDGWIHEFGKNMVNCFIVEPADDSLDTYHGDEIEASRFLDVIENKVLPMYYTDKKTWASIQFKAIEEVCRNFESARMADEYYTKMYLK